MSIHKKLDKVKHVLDSLELETIHSTGVNYHSGGFAEAELYNYDEDYGYIELKWGIQNDVSSIVHTEEYIIDFSDFSIKEAN